MVGSPVKGVQRGIGFPSSSREVARTPPNKNDSNGYYSELLLPPHASQREIREAYWRLARKYHPDGSSPDREKFRRVTEIYKTLSDSESKRAYDSVENGQIFLGPLELEELRESLPKSLLDELSLEEIRPSAVPEGEGLYYTFYGEAEDWKLGQEWYEFLLTACHLRGIETTLRVGVGDVSEGILCRTFMGRTTFYFDRSLTPSLESSLEALEVKFPSL